MLKTNHIIKVILLIILVSCKNNTATIDNKNVKMTTTISGEIKNAETREVLIVTENGFKKNLKLSTNNKFSINLDSITKTTMCYIDFNLNRQHFIINPNSTVHIIYDKSNKDYPNNIQFNGDNAIANNTLSVIREENSVLDSIGIKYENYNYKDFKKQYDSILKARKEKLIKLETKHKNKSKIFLELLEVNTLYPIYSLLDKYSKERITRGEDDINLKDVFETNRAHFDVAKEHLMFDPIYKKRISDIITYNIQIKGYELFSDNYYTHLLKEINRFIKKPKYKYEAMYEAVCVFFFVKSSEMTISKTLKTYRLLNANSPYKNKIEDIVKDMYSLNKGEKMINFALISKDKEITDFNKIRRKDKTVILFNNIDLKISSSSNTIKTINQLIKKHPKLEFIIVNNVDFNRYHLKNISNQFCIDDNIKTPDFIQSKQPRMIFIGKNNRIVTNYITPFSIDLDEKLISFKNQ